MPRTTPNITTQATAAIHQLHQDGRDDLASTVTALARYWDADPTAGTNRTLWLPADLKQRIPTSTAADEARKGLMAYLAGTFIPDRPQRAKYGAANKQSLTVRISDDLWDSIAPHSEQLTETLGWTPTHRQVAVAWLQDRFGTGTE